MKQSTLSDRSVVDRVHTKFVAVRLDASKHVDLAKRLRVRLYPTTAVVHPSGAVVATIPGYLGPKDFLKRLDSAQRKLAEHSERLASRKTGSVAAR